jgi:hypothetical protein
MGGAMVTTILGTKDTTHGVDVSFLIGLEQYGGIYPDIVRVLKRYAFEVYDDLQQSPSLAGGRA